MIVQGDVLEVTKGLESESFDAMLCDPPYGLSFMGKGWDTFEPEKIKNRKIARKLVYKVDYKKGKPVRRKKPYLCTRDSGARVAGGYDHSRNGHLSFQDFMTRWAKETLRVLKPGAFALVFGGTRTWHRLAVALEDAGFEIRDTLMWIYGSGFPKSHNISKGIDKAAGAEREVVGKSNRCVDRSQAESPYYGGAKDWENSNNLTAPVTPDAIRWNGYGTALKPSWEPVLLIRKPLGKVSSKAIRDVTGWDWWHNTTDITNTIKQRLKIFKRYGVRLPSGWVEVKVVKVSRKALHEGVESDVLFTATATRQWRGSPTPSKILARVDIKQYRAWQTKVNSANALKWHTGGLDIDGGRIAFGDDKIEQHTKAQYGRQQKSGARYFNQEGKAITFNYDNGQPKGRWPANLILDEQAAAMLDEQSGELTRCGNTKPSPVGKGSFGMGERLQNNKSFGDSGGASRFFYCAKASSSERNAGLEGFEEKDGVRINAPRENEDIKTKPRRNTHPTVKPLDLCKYLAKLIKPPYDDAKLLIPFSGSGSEMIGAIQAGWDEVTGIEIDSDYCKIAEARIEYWRSQKVQTLSAQSENTLPLFAETK